MEEHSTWCKGCKKSYPNFDMDLPEGKDLLKKFQNLSKTDKQKLIKSICQNKQCAEEANEAFEALVSLLKNQDNGISDIQKCWTDQEELEEEEEEEDEDSEGEGEDDVCNSWEKRKSTHIIEHSKYNLTLKNSPIELSKTMIMSKTNLV